MIKINPNAKKNVCCNCNKAFEIGVDLDLNGKFINKPKLCLECLTNLFLEIKASLDNKTVVYKVDLNLNNNCPN